MPQKYFCFFKTALRCLLAHNGGNFFIMSWFKLNSGNWLHQDGTLPVKKKGGGNIFDTNLKNSGYV